jgi:hypothetical protein
MNPPKQLIEILSAQVPQNAVAYCVKIWESEPFSFHVLRPRTTKLGDFRFRADRKIQTITLNSDLNPFQFLLTYLHEVAHLHVFIQHGKGNPPHGEFWKRKFQELMDPVLTESIFPLDILIPLKKHMKNPAASSTRDLFLMKEMSKYDHQSPTKGDEIFLSDLLPGKDFLLLGRKFKKGETLRTRVLCEEIHSGRKFLVSQLAKVKPI